MWFVPCPYMITELKQQIFNGKWTGFTKTPDQNIRSIFSLLLWLMPVPLSTREYTMLSYETLNINI